MQPSIFARPASPPPRAPSPEFIPTPLPPARAKSSSQLRSKASTSSLSGLDRSLFSTRSSSNLRSAATPTSSSAPTSPITQVDLKRKSSRATIDSAASSTPPTTPTMILPSPAPSKRTKSSRHQRSPSICIQAPITPRRSRSPPPLASPRELPPPVPPVPVILLTPTDKKPIIHPSKSAKITPIYLPELHNLSPLSEQSNPFNSSLNVNVNQPVLKSASSKEKRDSGRGIAMTCLKFFSIKNQPSAPSQVSV